MTKYLEVTMRDGSVWAVLAQTIANHRAAYYADKDSKSAQERATIYREEQEYALSFDPELIDWARNNMNWEDVAFDARKVRDRSPLTADDFRNAWTNGPMEVTKHM